MPSLNVPQDDANFDELLSLKDAANLVPGRCHISTIHRWRLSGVRGIRLCTSMIGGRRRVTRRQLEEFFKAISQAGEVAAPMRNDSLRQSQIAAAERESKDLGC